MPHGAHQAEFMVMELENRTRRVGLRKLALEHKSSRRKALRMR